MFGPPGTAYVYRSYGVHWCFNVVTGSEGTGEAVLIRALEPMDGIAFMRARRKRDDLKELCAGPGRLCEALGITGDLNGAVLAGPVLAVMAPTNPPVSVVSSPRIGISRACERPWRFCEADSRFLSRSVRAVACVPTERT
jgi:DNA-3-methyladenine glycosylase